MKECPNCKANVEEGQKFCRACGFKLQTAMQTEETLRIYLSKYGPITKEKALDMIRPVVDELLVMHEEGKAYGNINPDNILMKGKDAVCLRRMTEIPASYQWETSYTAPEVIDRKTGETAGDIYSLCAVLYRCISGNDPAACTERMKQDTLLLEGEFDAYLKQLLKVGMNLKSTARFKTLLALKNALYRENREAAKPKTPAQAKEERTVLLDQDDDRTMILNAQAAAPQAGDRAKQFQDTMQKRQQNPQSAVLPDFSESPVPKGNRQKKSKGNKLLIILAVLIALLAFGAGIVLFLIVGSGKKLSDLLPFELEKETETVTEEAAGDIEGGIDADALSKEADGLVKSAAQKMEEHKTLLEAISDLTKAVDLYIQIGNAGEEYGDKAQKGITQAVGSYEEAILMQLDLLYEQEPQKEVYEQIIMTIDDALALRDKAVEAGYEAVMDEVQESRDESGEKYRKRYIEHFNGFMEEYNWNVRHNEQLMKGALELFPSEDPDDPVGLRYKYAYAWLVHQEVVEGMNDGSLDAAGAAEKIIASLEETDYCEFLIREAEVYAFQSGGGSQKYFADAGAAAVLPDSSSREYTIDELTDLSPAQLRKARVEIYDRHEVTEENMYKFMSYNDFGEFSADPANGLTTTERHNIRMIVQAEIQKGNFMFP